jgi:hypothetical protein
MKTLSVGYGTTIGYVLKNYHMEMWNESKFTRIIRLSLQLFLSVSPMEHQWENVNLSQFIEFTKSHPTKNKLKTTHTRQQIRRQSRHIRNLHDF